MEMTYIVGAIVLFIICIQTVIFRKNIRRMHQFRDVFSEDSSWDVNKNDADGFVNGINGAGNEIFTNIKDSINEYLRNSAGSVIDFHLLMEAVNRHCESVEDDINAQTPIPLYCGLAGTMVGVILGLGSLLYTDAITNLLTGVGGGDASMVGASDGINHLLWGVALAMVASIFGIIYTTANSLLFKSCKLEEENGKNKFIAWMQARLLPELPSDTSAVMERLVTNLNKFNNTFTGNVSTLSKTFDKVNESYSIQAQIIHDIHEMDVAKMARANVKVLAELKECTEKLEQFNEYLDSVNEFNLQFSKQAETQEIFKKISMFFESHKAAIAASVADSNRALNKALEELNTNSTSSITTLNNTFVEQSETFKKILKEEREQFDELTRKLNKDFENSLSQVPSIARRLEDISRIPDMLQKVLSKVEESNRFLAINVNRALNDIPTGNAATGGLVRKNESFVMRIVVLVLLVTVALCCIINTVNGLFFNDTPQSSAPDLRTEEVFRVDTTAVDTI